MLALRLARRELRGGVRGLWIVLLCLALGVAVIAGVGTLRAATDRGLAEDGRRILGGDLEVESGSQPLPDSLRDWLRARGARMADVVQMRSMLVAPSGERQLVELKAVDQAWPLVGEVGITPSPTLSRSAGEGVQRPLSREAGEGRGGGVAALLADHGLLAEPVVLDRLNLHVGDTVRLGDASFIVRGSLVSEPDRVAAPLILGPRVLIAADALPSTGLIAPGSMVQYAIRATLPDAAAALAALRGSFPNEGWRIRDPRNAAPGVTRFIDQTSLFMTLVGLTSLLVGGIGVANGVRAWLDARARTIATLRCLGAGSGLVLTVCLLQVLALALGGIAIGLAVGGLAPIALTAWLKDILPVPPVPGIYPGPLALAATYGLLTALAFALWPLGRAARIPGAALFRDALIPERTRPSTLLVAANAAVAVALIALTIATSADRSFALWFCAAAVSTMVLFRLGASLVMLTARAGALSRRAPTRLGLGNLHRPGAATPLMLLSLGLGLSTLAAVALIQGNVRREIVEQLPADAPSFFFVDIQDRQLPRFEGLVRGHPGVADLQQVPSMRARIVAVNGVPADQVRATPETRWALRGDRGLTYAATPPQGTRIVAGEWWPADYNGPPLVSFDAGLARGWGIGIGDTIRVNVLGRDIDLRIASLRDIAWQTLSLNFTLVASPGLLAHAPHTHIATVRVADVDQGGLLRAVTDALPNVTGIRVQDVLSAVAALLDQVAAALAATGSLTLIAGALVLVGAVAAGQRRRIHEAVVLKTVGATRRQIRTAWMVEFGALGVAAGVIAAVVGTLASFGVVRYIMHIDWVFLPGTLGVTLGASLAMTLGFGYAGTAAALRAKAAPMLRNE
ncbi:MAG TPA: FtsX-like permease family protein [Acetobacteraceae bacterium]|nr:FtsX-like permease family protein [Acetobacteraceae bacterium]